MLEVLKAIHFLSFSVAIGAGVSNLVLGARLSGFPPQAMPQIGGYRLVLGKISTVGLVLLWLTGLTMLAMSDGSNTAGNKAFFWKIAAVVVLTLLSFAANMTVAKAKKAGSPPNALVMTRLGVASVSMAVVALVLAIIALT